MKDETRAPSTNVGRIVATYAIGASVWILASDHLVGDISADHDVFVALQNFKGLFFVAVTSMLLYSALALERRRLRKLEEERHGDRERIRLLSEHARDVVYRYRTVEPHGFEYVSPSVSAMTGYTPEEHYDDAGLAMKLVHEDDRDRVPGRTDDVSEEPILLRWRHRDGYVIWTEQRNVAVRDVTGRVVGIEGIARDVTNVVNVRERLAEALDEAREAREQAERNRDLATRLQHVIAALVETRTKRDVIQQIAAAGVEAGRAESCVIGLVDRGRRVLVVEGVRRQPGMPDLAFEDLPLDASSIPAHVVASGEPVWSADLAHDGGSSPRSGGDEELFGSTSFACIPLNVEGRVLGTMSLVYDRPQEIDATTRTFLVALAQQCANAFARTILREDLERSRQRLFALSHQLIEAQESERRRIARELHDEFGQLLGALNFKLHIAIDRAAASGDPTPDELRDSVEVLEELFAQVRSLSRELRPSVLDELGLHAAIEWLAERFSERSDVDVAVDSRGSDEGDLSPAITTTAYRIVQECLNNVVKHAEASRATVVVDCCEDGVDLEVRDDGRGFDVDAALQRATEGSSIGLLSLIERAELVGGHTEITSRRDGGGTVVKVRLPAVSKRAAVGRAG